MENRNLMKFTESFGKYKSENYGYVRLPKIDISTEQKASVGLSENASNLDFLLALARKGFKEKTAKIPKDKWKEYGDRIKYEIGIFDELGFVDYILLVWMVINKARELGVFIDYGRGSVAGSATCWLLGISGVNAVEKQLIFERFVSRARAGKKYINGDLYLKGELLADVDINLGNGRDAIVDWLREIYPNRISKILNLSTFTTKILLKDVYKSLKEVDESEAKRVSDMIDVHFGIAQEIEEAYESNKEFKAWADKEPEVVAIAKKLSGLTRQTSVHASGYVCSFFELRDIVPLELSKDGELISGYDMREICNFAVKLDLLGLATNRIIKSVIDNIPENIENLNLDNDPFIYDKFQDGKLLPYGLYQISADCAYKVLNNIKPKDIYELSDVSAIARPGALAYESGYQKGDHKCPHPLFENILGRTRNYCLYQEQMMQMAVVIGFTLEESEQLRKIVGKKLVDKVKEWKDKIYKKCEENGFGREIGDILWKVLEDSAKYSFNLSHSLSTSYLSALTVYLKYKYPLQWYWSCLCATKDLANPIEEVTQILAELPVFGIKILPPDILLSAQDYTIEPEGIRTGLSGIKGLSEAALAKLATFKTTVSSKFDLFLSLENSKIPLNITAALILSGAMDSIKGAISRNKLLFEFEVWKELTDKEKIYINNIGSQYEYDLLKLIKLSAEEFKNEKGKPIIKESRRETLRKYCAPYVEKYKRNSQFEELTAYIAESTFLGYSYSHTLKGIYSPHIENLKTIKELEGFNKACCICQVREVEKRTSIKNRTPYLSVQCADETGSFKGFVWGAETQETVIKQNGREVKEGDIIFVRISRKDSKDALFYINELLIQDVPTTFKKSTIEKELAKAAEKETVT